MVYDEVAAPQADVPMRTLVVRLAVVVSLVSAVIHFAVAGEHYQEYWAFGVFMLGSAWFQLGWSAAMLWRPSRLLLISGAIVNAGVVAVYVITRTVGDVVGPTPHDVEPVGFGDALCTAAEAIVVLLAVALLVREFSGRVRRPRALAVSLTAPVVAAVLLSISLVAGGPEMVMAMGDDDATMPAAQPVVETAADVTTSPAGPVQVPSAMMAMGTGMKMASGPCTTQPTAAQTAAAVNLVDSTWAGAKRYQSLSAAENDGFFPITPTGLPVVHYVNAGNYLKTLEGGPVLDPSAPQSLVYANTSKGAVLVAAMYIQSAASSETPQPGGCLTQWHEHTNLCFGHGLTGVVGLTSSTGCAAGSKNRITPPMMHVWFVPVPGGPTAIDASDHDVVAAARKVWAPANGRA